MPIKAVVFDAYGTLFDIQSVEAVINDAYPGYGEMITQIWRIKQLEYSWLRSMMRCYEDFGSVTQASLRYTLRVLGLSYEPAVFDRIMQKYVQLDVYPDTVDTLSALAAHDLAILSNGSPAMLDDLVRNTGVDRFLKATISVNEVQTFKPSPEAYGLVEKYLHLRPPDVLFVSSNPFDVCGAKAFGFKVAWIERVTAEAMAAACARCDLVTPVTMFRAIRQQMDELEMKPDYTVPALIHLPELLTAEAISVLRR